MSQTLAELLVRVNELISDPNNQKFAESSKIRAINTVLQDLISSRILSYTRSTDIQFRDGEYTYDFPSDMIEPAAIMFQELTGQVIANSSWRGLVGNLEFTSTQPYDSNVFWQATTEANGKLILRDIVPDNQFIITPLYDADLESNSVVRQATMPTTAVEGDYWVDTLNDENYVYKATDSYSTTTDQATLTIPAESLAAGTTTDLVFTAVATGLTYIQIAITTTLSPASVATTGAGTRVSPYVITFSLPVTDNSNDTIIGLAATTGKVTATGADADYGAITDLAATDLDNPSSQYWEPRYIHLIYRAVYPKMVNSTDTLDESLSVLIREGDCIPLGAASKLLKMVRGDQRLMIMVSQYEKEFEDIIRRVRYHRRLTGAPCDLIPL